MMRAGRVAAIAALAFELVFAGKAAPARAQDQPLIRVGASTDDAVRPLLYAARGGVFKKYGLDVEIVKLQNGAAVAAAVAGGSIDIGKGSTLTEVLAHAKGLPFVVTWNLDNYSSTAPNVAMLVRNDSPIKTVRDLAGRTVGVIGLQDLNSLSIYALLEQNGIDPAAVKFIEVPNSAAIAALEQSRIDATVALEPAYTTAMSTGEFRVLAYPWSALGKRFSDAVLFATTDYVAAHKDVLVRFNRAMHDAAVYVSAHEDETKPLIAQFAGFDPATLQNFHPGQRAVTLSPADLQPTIDVAAHFRLIPKAFPAADIICSCGR